MSRVKISYGVDIEEVPSEVQKLFDDVNIWLDKLSKQQDTVDDLLETKELESCVVIMDKIRQTLGDMDARLSDLSSILQGYIAYMKQTGEQNDTSEGRPAMDTTSGNVIQRPEQSDGGEVE